jgi:fructokinase
MKRIVAVEGGGTTFVVALAENTHTNVIERYDIETTCAQETLQKVKQRLSELYPFDCLGIATFGPLELNEKKDRYGYITTTPKMKWRDTDVVGSLMRGTAWERVPFGFDTDVNAPAMAEFAYHNSNEVIEEEKEKEKGDNRIESLAYITVGTGIGVGLVVNNKCVHGLLHPEAGHIHLTPDKWQYNFDDVRDVDDVRDDVDDSRDTITCDHFKGTCPFHGSCVEGMASSIALAKRAHCTIEELKNLKDDDIIWDKCAHHLGGLCANLLLIASPEKIVLSGGVMRRTVLFPKIREKVYELLHGYIGVVTKESLEKLIVPSRWGDTAGIIGSLYLAETAFLVRNNDKSCHGP